MAIRCQNSSIFKGHFLGLLYLVIIAISRADFDPESFEYHHHEKALEATKGFGEFVDHYLSNQGIGRVLHPHDDKEMIQKKPTKRTPSITEHARSSQKSDRVLLRECLKEVLEFDERTRPAPEKPQPSRSSIDNGLTDIPTDFPTEFPTSLSHGDTDRKLQYHENQKRISDEDPTGHFFDSLMNEDDDHNEDDDDDYDYDEDDYAQHYIVPSWLSAHTFGEMHRKLSTCEIPRGRSERVSEISDSGILFGVIEHELLKISPFFVSI